LAEIIFGYKNPSGKLSVSFPQSVGHLPVYYNYLPSDKGYYRRPDSLQQPGRDFVFSSPDDLWPCGFGLSHSSFDHEKLMLNKKDFTMKDTIKISVRVSNKSDLPGKEVVQVYVRDVVSSVVTPVKQLKRFLKKEIPARQSKSFKF